MKLPSIVIFTVWCAAVATAQFSKQQMDSVRAATEQDYHFMLAQLHIDSLRPGPSGNPKAPNAANVDESQATRYSSLPDPLVFNDGGKVIGADAWWKKRRPEIVELFDREMYGRVPEHVPGVKWRVVSITHDTIEGIPAVVRKLSGHVDNSSFPDITVEIPLTLTLPEQVRVPVPVVMEFGFVLPPGFKFPDPPPGTPREPNWKQLVLSKGWGYAIIVPSSYQADWGAGLTHGIIGLVNKGQRRKPDDWGALRAWAWGASRALDYFETDPSVNAKKVVIEGLSRYGKAALVTMAYDSRFAMAFVGSSGAGGVKILRRVFGEQVENLASSGEYHWFGGNFLKYAGPLTRNDLPVDAHELVALCAPRPVFIGAGSFEMEGGWVDAKGMFLGGAYASPVYELLGKKGLGTYEFPPIQTSLIDGEIAFRQHKGGHTTGPNWPTFLTFTERYFR
ncbi:MAG: acetylxylan esterase [Ignavibacteria bacterium]|nr:acetylxylan esterase [Ignavibacteria bacterium]